MKNKTKRKDFLVTLFLFMFNPILNARMNIIEIAEYAKNEKLICSSDKIYQCVKKIK